jgi:hypothetical protein
MNRMIVSLSVGLSLLCTTLCQAGDAGPSRTDAAIEKVVAASMAAAARSDWKAYAALVHPDSLQDYKNMWLPVVKATARQGPEQQAELLSLFKGARDLKSLSGLAPKEFFVNSMTGLASRFKGVTAPFPVPQVGSTAVDSRIIGTVHDGADLAYVVVRSRIKYPGSDLTKVDVVTVKRSGKEWKLMLPEVVRVMADTFRRTLQAGPDKSGTVTDSAEADK